MDLVFCYLTKFISSRSHFIDFLKAFSAGALAGVAQWIECRPCEQRAAGSIPSLGHMPGLRARSLVGGIGEATQ